MRTIDNINDLNKSDFLSVFGNVFEKTESVALEAFNSKPFKNFEDIMFKMLNIYESYEKNKILEILNAHPELAVAKKMTTESILEQASAKLNECSYEEYEEFIRLNSEYKKKFNFLNSSYSSLEHSFNFAEACSDIDSEVILFATASSG